MIKYEGAIFATYKHGIAWRNVAFHSCVLAVKIDRILHLCQFAFVLVIGVISQQRTDASYKIYYHYVACALVVLSLSSSFFFLSAVWM